MTKRPALRPVADQPARVTRGELATIVGDLLGDAGSLNGLFAQMEWAEQEIDDACRRHPQHPDRLYHSFSLLTPTQERMSTEFVFRSHCAELLDRLAAGEDTRPGTAAEICCAMAEVSLATPLRSSAAGLYMRMWRAARFPDLEEFAESSRRHEALERSTIDEHEQFARRRLAVADRRLGDIDCPGRHRGEPVKCPYATADQLAIGL